MYWTLQGRVGVSLTATFQHHLSWQLNRSTRLPVISTATPSAQPIVTNLFNRIDHILMQIMILKSSREGRELVGDSNELN